ncbi:MAG: exodeoxyribonuclease VII large subunit [Syntrophomonadaceae bacterium]|nr:exodeoxyribonuclease VII large subunit [Syntrophomonadaceae bacterium]
MRDFITVSKLNEYLNQLINSDEFLVDFWLMGEISGLKLYQQSGHMYFTLKDEETSISCVMFKSRNRSLEFKPEDGMEVLARGYVSIYARQGKYQFYVEKIHPYGQGGLFLYLEKLKKKLQKAGCFDLDKKKSLPGMVNKVGIVTSQDGAALRDILRVLRQRHPDVEIILVHSSVQGVDAPGEIAQGIRLLNQQGYVDVIIIGRGGGSFEDLMAFNSEEVVLAINDSVIPVISAVGHEVDISLADLAADLRAATPTQAAQMAVPDILSLQKEIVMYQQRLIKAVDRHLAYYNETLDHLMMEKVWQEPHLMIEKQEEFLQDLQKNLARGISNIIKEKGTRFAFNLAKLDSLSPVKILQRGYAVIRKDDKIVRDEANITQGDYLKVSLENADLGVVVRDKEKIIRWEI